jgi:phosphate transport system substrate-binding protein
LKLNRFGGVMSVVAAGALIVSGCGNDNNNATGAGGTTTGASASTVSCGGKKTLKASGSTAQANAMTRFVKAFEGACPDQTLNYTPNGSGAGVHEFNGNQTDFGGSDSPLSQDEYAAAQQRCGGSPALDLPTVFGPIAITYNVKGVSSLVLDAATAAKIFKGAITSWNDPAIQALNKGLTLPAEPIRVVFRSDMSGTTDNFQKYLDAASRGSWGKGTGKAFNGGVGEGAKGNDGTSSAVKAIEGAITYNEWWFAEQKKLNMAKIITPSSPDAVAISTESVSMTIGGAAVVGRDNDMVLDTVSFYNPTQPGAYPIVMATYEIVCSKYADPQVGTAVRAFLESALGPGQDGLADNGYIPIPNAWKSWLLNSVNAIA